MGKKPRNDKPAAETTGKQTKHDNTNHNLRNGHSVFEKSSRQTSQTKQDYRQLQLQDSKDYSSFKVVLFYCSLIVFLPVLTFFMLKSFVLDSLFTLSEVQGNIYAAVGAVAALHIALGVYIYRAYFSSTDEGVHKKIH